MPIQYIIFRTRKLDATAKNRFQIYNLHPKNGNYPEKCPVRIWKRDTPLLTDLLISNNISSMTFFCATRILWVIGRQNIVYNHSWLK